MMGRTCHWRASVHRVRHKLKCEETRQGSKQQTVTAKDKQQNCWTRSKVVVQS